MNHFPALTAPRPLIFLSNVSNIDENALVTNLGKMSLAKGTASFISASLPNIPIALPWNLPDWVILSNWASVRLISVDLLLAK